MDKLLGFTKQQLQDFYDESFDRGFMEATTQIKKTIFGAKNMARAKLRIARIESAVVNHMKEREIKREHERHLRESEIKSKSGGSTEGGLSGTNSNSIQSTEGSDKGLERVEETSQSASSAVSAGDNTVQQ